MTNRVRTHASASLLVILLTVLVSCNGPTVPPGMQKMTLARHNAEKFPTFHGKAENPSLDCNRCHGGFDSFSKFTCLGCHAHEQAANDKWHAGIAAYKYASENCYACHPTGEANGAPANHFPIDAGTPHADAACAECHTGGDYKTFSCTDCHKHEKSATDTKHAGVTDYVYASQNCLGCHPDGRGFDPAQHEAFFPIAAGAHAGNQCKACHTQGSYQSFSCVECHTQSPMSSAHAGVPSYVFASTNCLSCHPKGKAFSKAEHTPFFPTTSGAHSQFQCNDCHSDGTNFGIFTCTQCHLGNHACSNMSDKHSSVSGFQCADASCLACHPNGTH